jgi:large subunit ribosomal protein L24
MKIRKNDTVIVLSGDDKGKTGKVLKVFPEEDRIIVEGVNFIKRHMRATQKNPKGGILEKESPLAVSKVLFQCPKCGANARVGGKIIQAQDSVEINRVRICKKCGEIV